MTLRSKLEGALNDWNHSVAQLNEAIAGFMDDGLQTDGGTWILTMNQSRSDSLRSAYRQEDVARTALDRIMDDVRRLEAGQPAARRQTLPGHAPATPDTSH